MKKVIIASLVATLIVFVYQALSWMVLPFHTNSMEYLPQQDTVLALLDTYATEDGVYRMPGTPPDLSQADHENMMAEMEGKPWAMVHFHKSYHNSMGSAMVIGILLNLFAALIVSWLLSRCTGFTTFLSRWLAVMAFAVFSVLQADLMDWNWWQTPASYLTGEVIDTLLGWALAGLWLGWYMGRAPRTRPA